MSDKLDSRIVKTYKLLSAALFSLLENKPFDAISVSHICQTAMVSRATFYAHFEDKYHLLQYAYYTLKKELSKKEEPHAESGPSVIISIIEHIHNHKDVYKNLFAGGPHNQHHTIISQLVADDMKKLIQEKGAIIPLPAEITAQFVTGGIMNVIHWWVTNDFPIHKDEIIQYMINHTAHPMALMDNFA